MGSDIPHITLHMSTKSKAKPRLWPIYYFCNVFTLTISWCTLVLVLKRMKLCHNMCFILQCPASNRNDLWFGLKAAVILACGTIASFKHAGGKRTLCFKSCHATFPKVKLLLHPWQDGEGEKKDWNNKDRSFLQWVSATLQEKDEEEESELFVGDCVRALDALMIVIFEPQKPTIWMFRHSWKYGRSQETSWGTVSYFFVGLCVTACRQFELPAGCRHDVGRQFYGRSWEEWRRQGGCEDDPFRISAIDCINPLVVVWCDKKKSSQNLVPFLRIPCFSPSGFIPVMTKLVKSVSTTKNIQHTSLNWLVFSFCLKHLWGRECSWRTWSFSSRTAFVTILTILT